MTDLQANTEVLEAACGDYEQWAEYVGASLTEEQKRTLRCMDSAEEGSIKRIDLGRGEGKTFLSVFVTLKWLLSHEYGQAIVCCPTLNQSRHIWLYEAKKQIAGSRVLHRSLKTTSRGVQVRETGACSWRAYTIPPRPQNLHGVHAKHMLIVSDEYRHMPELMRDIFKETICGPPDNHALLIS